MTKREAFNRLKMTTLDAYVRRASKPDPYFSVTTALQAPLENIKQAFDHWWISYPRQIAKNELKLDLEALVIIEKVINLKVAKKKSR